jgi:hypothetical protein
MQTISEGFCAEKKRKKKKIIFESLSKWTGAAWKKQFFA